MSRHKLVKGLDLEEELDDYDGAEDDTYEEELAPEDKEHLRQGTIEVRSTLGPDFPTTDKEIEDSLYYYYYDVQKTVNYLLNQKTPTSKPQKGKTKPNEATSTSAGKSKASFISNSLKTPYFPEVAHLPVYNADAFSSMACPSKPLCCPAPFSVTEFFKDSPWLNIPENRRAKITIEPLYPRGRLLGGSPAGQDAPPKSKLAALAAARKKKENASSGGKEVNSSVALLDKLGTFPQTTRREGQSDLPLVESMNSGSKSTDFLSRKYPAKRQVSKPTETRDRNAKRSQSSHESIVKDMPVVAPAPIARPSTFASTLFGAATLSKSSKDLEQSPVFFPAYARADTENDPFAGPSPDDVVRKAQTSKVSKSAKEPTKAPESNNTSRSAVTQGVPDLTVVDTTKVKSKNLDVVNEYKRSEPKSAANFVVIGHVDAGKSTLMGRLLHDVQVVDQRTIDKYQREASKIGKSSFALAWVLDQGTEERARGVTIDVATNQFSTATTEFTILDAPGHRDFIPNMIAGASRADFAILVIDAGTGNFESGLKGQTKEHALLVRSMGVQRIVVAVNKLDSIAWSEDRFHEIQQQISAFLTTAGFLSRNVSFVPCSGLTGDNIVHPATAPEARWTADEPTLITALESSQPITRALEKPLRLTIDDIFRGGVQNPLSISGRLDAGTVQIGDTILVMPANQTATIKALDVNTEPADWAVAGQNCVLHLTDIEQKYLRPGDVVCPPSAPIPCVRACTVKLLAFEHIMPTHCEIHRGRLHAPGRVTKLVAILDKASGVAVKGKKPRLIKPGSVARVVVEVDEAIPVELGGRVILRAGGETIGAGLVE